MKASALQLIQSDRPEKWQQILADLITDPKELLEILQLDPGGNPLSDQAHLDFPLKVPRPFAARIRKGDWQDPLLRQIWPAGDEAQPGPDLVNDPLQEQQFNPVPGILHKYPGRVLLMAAPHCAIHCRYCFRRHFDYDANSPGRRQWQESLAWLEQDDSIHEVILSGGDPLANSDRQLAWLVNRLDRIPHLTTLRLHTRLPVVIPQRVSSELLTLLGRSRLHIVLVNHVNHAQEIDADCLAAFDMLSTNGVILLNQSVLLAGVNDNYAALTGLSQRLISGRVLPYYLHLPDKVAGTRHFQVSLDLARDLIAQMRATLPGYLIPRLVQEVPGQASKTPLL